MWKSYFNNKNKIRVQDHSILEKDKDKDQEVEDMNQGIGASQDIDIRL